MHYWSNLRNSVDRALDMSSYLCVLGDTNVKNHKLIDLITRFTLNNIITGPTRLCNTRESLLDIILFSDACKCTESSIIAVDQDISDHHATVAVIDIPIELSRCYSREVWNYKHADFNMFNYLIDEFNWNAAFENCNNVITKRVNILRKNIQNLRRHVYQLKQL